MAVYVSMCAKNDKALTAVLNQLAFGELLDSAEVNDGKGCCE